jgi:hypothetical protein
MLKGILLSWKYISKDFFIVIHKKKKKSLKKVVLKMFNISTNNIIHVEAAMILQLKYLPNTWWGKKFSSVRLKIWRINREENSKFSRNCNEEKRFVPNVCAELSLKNKTWMRITTLSSLQQKRGVFIHVVYGWRARTHVWFVLPLEHLDPHTCKQSFSLNLAAG